mmetsp:Transcript_13028/g.36956  ORF Transcript_13028/g.36956 Transcript_13028/m.36956 type:complete len:444 (+) Transcript_13028:255-1586(+)|eukprot:CAMPEP_0119119020 /NCGR_PEP_ID=MMETSP1310-20130426/696_1 /TAXON_ID=464262 /ORGANISM="Genus nov. species nov., Strain RCC2339" /LENGTH=443 /DNA_ID=CAMNT_0007108431 /DNA_START=212 /DNA_END=1543 /DNA_ORIENTATION=+
MEGKGVNDNLWYLHGKAYDFEKFLDSHPGGKSFLILGKGRDCTELFEGVHALSKRDFDPLFRKYEVQVDTPIPKTEFDWSPKAKMMHELRRDVAQYFDDNNLDFKATTPYYVAVLAILAVLAGLYYVWITSTSLWVTLAAAAACGVVDMTIAFFVMHPASHGALSHDARVNYWGTVFFSSFLIGWVHAIWLQHHVLGHHSYTGIYGKDPDVRNVAPFIRKSHEQKARLPQQHMWELFIMIVMPNQYVGQVLTYIRSFTLGKLFGMPIRLHFTLMDSVLQFSLFALFLTLTLVVPVLRLGWGLGLASSFLFFTGVGIMYWAFVFPNHDVEEVHHNSTAISSPDWAVHQIVNSSNFYTPYVISQLTGAMNFQIEHHLFPAVHPIHLPNIAPIVEKACKKYDIPYVSHQSWLGSFFSHHSFIKLLNRDPVPPRTPSPDQIPTAPSA